VEGEPCGGDVSELITSTLKLEHGCLCKQVARYAFSGVGVNAYLKKFLIFTGCMTAQVFIFLITARLRAFSPRHPLSSQHGSNGMVRIVDRKGYPRISTANEVNDKSEQKLK